MYGYDIAELNVYTRTFVGGPLKREWTQKGSRGDEWLPTTVVLKVSQNFQVLIEGVRGVSFEGRYMCRMTFLDQYICCFSIHF